MVTSKRGSKDLIRAINYSIILNKIKEIGPVSRAELAKVTGLSSATLTGISAQIIADGLIFEKEMGESKGGRKPILLALNPSGGYAVGIKLTENTLIGVLVNFVGEIIERYNMKLVSKTPESVADLIGNLTEELIKRSQVPKDKLLGVGVGAAGLVDFDRGMLITSPFFRWRNVPFSQLVQNRVGVKTYVDNDVNTLMVAEQLFGAGQNLEHFITITIGRGLGMGIVVNGQIYRGVKSAGEFGHITVHSNGRQCACGKRGCLETLVSDEGLLISGREVCSEPVDSVDDLLQLAESDHNNAQNVFAQAGTLLGAQIANLITVLSPMRIIIGGEGVRFGDWIFKPMHQTIKENIMPYQGEATEVVVEPWGDDRWAVGAGCLVLGEFVKSPLYRNSSYD
jgi:predicted NBD/HSP70 family sugar kinase